MGDVLNFLMIEDSQADFLLIERHLKQSGLAARCSRVSNLDELKCAIDMCVWDVVLSDYSIPQLNFLDSLELVRSRLPDLPLILVSGSIGEEKAAELLKMGVWDFVLKGSLARLAPAIERGLRDAADRRARKAAEEALRKNEAGFRLLFENMLEGYAQCRMIYDGDLPRDFIYLGVNKAFERLTGLKNVVGKKVSEVIPGIRESNPELLEIYGRVASTGRPERFETYVEPLRTWFSVSVYGTERDCFNAVFDNITERKRAEETREATIELLRICNEAVNLRELMWNLVGYFHKTTGCEAIGVRLREGEDFPYYVSRGFPEEFVQAENSLCAIDQAGELVRDTAGHPALDCMCGNILCGRFDDAKPFFTPRGSFWSSNTTELLATTTETDRQAKTRNRCNGEGYESVALVPLHTGDETFGLFQFNDRRTGRFTAEKIALLEERVGYVAIALAKLKSDEALQESSLFNRQVINSVREGVVVLDSKLRLQVWNPLMEELSGLSAGELIGRQLLEVFPSSGEMGVLDMIESALAGHMPPPVDLPYHFPASGRSGWFSGACAPLQNSKGESIGVISTLRDITERKKAELQREQLEAELRQAQKMEAIGQLAGGIAHDFNNMLSVILGFSQMGLARLAPQDPLYKELLQIERAGQRSADLTRKLLAFSRKQDTVPLVINLNEVIEEQQKMLSRLIGEDIRIDFKPDDDLWNVLVDPSQVDQVLTNLAVNARDAIGGVGTVAIATANITLDDTSCHATLLPPGDYVMLTFSDSGCGMDATTKERIFEPFFTTKEEGKGTGLGLSTVYGIVRQNEGMIHVYSEAGIGTTFRIYFPRNRAAKAGTGESPHEVSLSGSETVLIVEDEEQILALARTILEQCGYKVLTAATPEEACLMYEKYCRDIHLLLSDVVMPGMNGKELQARIESIRPGFRTLFMSGYTSDIIAHRGIIDQGVEFVPKPFTAESLSRKVREVLDAQQTGG